MVDAMNHVLQMIVEGKLTRKDFTPPPGVEPKPLRKWHTVYEDDE